LLSDKSFSEIAARLHSIEERTARLETLEFASIYTGGCIGLIERIEVPPAGLAVVTFDNIPPIYHSFWLISTVWRGGVPLYMRFNGDAGANYHWRYWRVTFNNVQIDVRNQADNWGYLTGVDPVGYRGISECLMPCFREEDFHHKVWKCHNVFWDTVEEGGAIDEIREDVQGKWDVNAVINRIDIYPNLAVFINPSCFSLYGMC